VAPASALIAVACLFSVFAAWSDGTSWAARPGGV